MAFTDPTGFELYKSDGISVTLVEDIRPGGGATGDSNPEDLINVNGTLFFSANDGSGMKLWKSTGPSYNAASTAPVTNQVFNKIDDMRNINGTLYFTAQVESGDREGAVADGWHQPRPDY